jgi:hypothetical protein
MINSSTLMGLIMVSGLSCRAYSTTIQRNVQGPRNWSSLCRVWGSEILATPAQLSVKLNLKTAALCAGDKNHRRIGIGVAADTHLR